LKDPGAGWVTSEELRRPAVCEVRIPDARDGGFRDDVTADSDATRRAIPGT
jgi:hypothetical protein